MFKTFVKLEHIIEEKAHEFICDPQTSLENIKESLLQFLRHVANLEASLKQAQEVAKNQAAAPTEAPAAPEDPKKEVNDVAS